MTYADTVQGALVGGVPAYAEYRWRLEMKEMRKYAAKLRGEALISRSQPAIVRNVMLEQADELARKAHDVPGKISKIARKAKLATWGSTGALGLVGFGFDLADGKPWEQAATSTVVGMAAGVAAGQAVGAGAAMLSATVAGAAAGSVVPIVGTVLGAAVGLAVGALASGVVDGLFQGQSIGEAARSSWGSLTEVFSWD